MSIQILGGELKGLAIQVPKNQNTRPTSVMMRRRIFDANQSLEGVHFIDLCAGTGAMGIEAYSRGAGCITLIEKDPNSYRTLKQNVSKAQNRIFPNNHFGRINCLKTDFRTWLKQNPNDDSDDSFIPLYFLDPPYNDLECYEDFAIWIRESEQGPPWLWIESDSKKGLVPEKIESLFGPSDKIYKQGTSFLCTFNSD